MNFPSTYDANITSVRQKCNYFLHSQAIWKVAKPPHETVCAFQNLFDCLS